MQSVKDIKNRIKSISETAKITKAMELISASKMQKSSVRYNNSQAYFNQVRRVIYDIVAHTNFDEKHPYLTDGRSGKRGYVVIGSDKGMSGEYNHAVINFASNLFKEADGDYVIYCIGNTVYQHFLSEKENAVLLDCSPDGNLEDARIIATRLIEMYKSGELSEIDIVYMSLASKSKQVCAVLKLLPILLENFEFGKPEQEPYVRRLEFAPDAKSVFDILAPQYLLGVLYSCITSGKYTEHLERMRAMNAATKNANELLESLQIYYNKARQEKITTELTELTAALTETD